MPAEQVLAIRRSKYVMPFDHRIHPSMHGLAILVPAAIADGG